MAKKKAANLPPKLTETEQDLLSHIQDGYQLEGELKMAIPAEMGRQVAVVVYVVAMAAVIVGVDFVFFRNRFWERLTVNIGIVLVFAAFYLRFLRRP
jgi:hypothetical protein